METMPFAVKMAAESSEAPLVIYGPPGELRGTIRLHNSSAERIRLAGLRVELPDLRGPAGEALEVLQVGARLEPNQQSSIQASLRVDPSTPPGTYAGTLFLGDGRRGVQVHVCEDLRARIEPRHLTLFSTGQTTFDTTFVVENLGNVPFHTGSLCVAPLVDATRFGDPLVRGLTGSPERQPQEVFRDFLVAWAQQQVGTIRLLREDVIVQPGQTTIGKVRIELPRGLKPHRRYQSSLEIYSVAGRIDVYTDRMPDAPEAASGPQQVERSGP